MKVLILGFTKISYMPYMHFYIEQLKKHGCETHLVYWKRDNEPDAEKPNGVITHAYERYQEDSVPIYKKIPSFLGYRQYAGRLLKRINFDLVIVLHSTPGVLLYDLLNRKYKEEYILDYRDFTYENIYFYKAIVHSLVKNSRATFVSSDAYRKYLPKENPIYTSHNIVLKAVENAAERVSYKKKSKLIIRFWGFIRHEAINMVIINRLGNDERFELHYHGREQLSGSILKEYCRLNHFTNIYFHGEYLPEQRLNFIRETDLIHNIYENDVKTVNALGNKYYDGVVYQIPQICNEGSFMGNKVKENGIGVMLDPKSQHFANEIWNYYNAINWDAFNISCTRALETVLNEYGTGVDIIEKIIRKKD